MAKFFPGGFLKKIGGLISGNLQIGSSGITPWLTFGDSFRMRGINGYFEIQLFFESREYTFKDPNGDNKLIINGDTGKITTLADCFRIQNSKTPSSATATGNVGDIAWDSGYIYVCTATNTWKRVAIASW